MKKYILILIFIIISINLHACSCITQRIIDRYAKSDFVATVKILNVDAKSDDSYLNIEVEIIELYKGKKINFLKIFRSNSCAAYTPENTKWLIFASKDKQGNLSFGYCSGAKQLDKVFNEKLLAKFPNIEQHYKSGLERKINLLQYLRNNKINPNNIFDIHTSFPYKSLRKFDGYVVTNEKFALYELTVEKDLSISEIKELKKFNNDELSKELLNFIREKMNIGIKGRLNEIPKQTKVIFGFYYYPARRVFTSTIGTFAI